VPGVGEDAEQAGDPDLDPGFFLGLADGALGDGLAEFLLAHRDGPLAGVAAPLEQHSALCVDGEDPRGGDEAVGFGARGLTARPKGKRFRISHSLRSRL
jgi:hypothetical protein